MKFLSEAIFGQWHELRHSYIAVFLCPGGDVGQGLGESVSCLIGSKFSAQFRAEAVELVAFSDRPIVQVAQEIGVSDGTLGNWVRAWKEEYPEVSKGDPGPVEWAKYKALQAENAELKREIEFLGKSQCLLRREATLDDYYALISQEKAHYPVDWMCQQLKVSRSSYYRWCKPAQLTPTQVRNAQLTKEVCRVFAREKGMPGRDQITTILGHECTKVAPATVGAIMNKQGLRAVWMRAWKKTTLVDPAARTELIRNHMLDAHGKRDFTATVPGTKLVGDITYLKTGSGWLYLATVIDLATWMVVE